MEKIGKLSLNGTWKIHQETTTKLFSAEVPGSVYISLMQAKIIEDPFYAENERDMEWIYNANWVYEKEFNVNSEFLEYEIIKIRFWGIDTVADIYINGDLIGKTNNMFLKYEFEIKNKLRVENNQIKIIIYSPIKEAAKNVKIYGYKLTNFFRALGLPYLRKAQYCFGWDLTPKLPDMGIWKSVEIIGYNEVIINSVYCYTTFTYNIDPLNISTSSDIERIDIESVKLNITVELISEIKNLSSLDLILEIILIDPMGKKTKYNTNLKEKIQSIELVLSNPYLWWTNDLGKANLYSLKVSLVKDQNVIDSTIHRIGIRDFRLIRRIDDYGESFYFLLNGVPLFAKGSNWVPIDMFIARGKKLGLYEKSVRAVAEANTNMLRVWGGGIYEDDLFYDLCDELGILVWQDFPFACALYPPFDEFNENVRKEAICNIKRIRNHPSLGIWCGNNEVEMQFDLITIIDEIKSDDQKKLFKDYYIKLFEDLLPNLINELDPLRPYWPSSPSNSSINNNSGFLESPSPNTGDMHYYGVWHESEPIEKYRAIYPRFMSEFGLLSFPTIKTIKTFCPLDQFDIKSSVMKYHNKDRRGGNRKIIKYIKKRFQNPKTFRNQVIISQIMQGDGLEHAIDHWRKYRNKFKCMGALYWQTNDCFPGSTWATIDYNCRWKASHYIIKRVFNPLYVSIEEKEKCVELWSINDSKEIKNCKLHLAFRDPQGNILLKQSKTVKMPPCSAQLIESIDFSKFMNTSTIDKEEFIIFYSLKDNEPIKSKEFYGFHLLTAPKNFELLNPELSYNIEKIDSPSEDYIEYEIEIIAKNIALYVFFDLENLDFIASDNYFALEPGISRTIKLKVLNKPKIDKEIMGKNIYKDIKVYSLYNLRNE